jgi:polyisoprenoid-binding protein YceI
MKIVRHAVLAALVALPLLAQAPAKEKWVIDKPHSSAEFTVRYLMSKVGGEFRDMDAVVQIDRANPAQSSVEFTIQAKSIDTRDAKRDEHLRSPDFFEVEKYPTISFKSAAVAPRTATEFDVLGDLTMHGVTKRVTVPVTFNGFGRDPRGAERAGFSIETTLDRKDYGITWNRVLDEGGVLLGDEVKIEIEITAKKQ